MTLAEFVAHLRRQVLDALTSGSELAGFNFDPDRLKEGKRKGPPQAGAVRFTPTEVRLEFLFTAPGSAATVLEVSVAAPERIVWMPVPDWVIENIWEGEVIGSFAFESEALQRVNAYIAKLAQGINETDFGQTSKTRRG
jgi:hypothetical protein